MCFGFHDCRALTRVCHAGSIVEGSVAASALLGHVPTEGAQLSCLLRLPSKLRGRLGLPSSPAVSSASCRLSMRGSCSRLVARVSCSA